MKWFEKHPMSMIVVGILGVSLSAIFVKYSQAPSVGKKKAERSPVLR